MSDVAPTTQFPAEQPPPQRWTGLLGSERKQRIRTGQALLALAMVVLCVAWGVGAGLLAGTPLAWLLAWALTALGAQLLCVQLVRSGRSALWADPALSHVQIVQTLVLTHVVYPMTGELRVAAFPIAIVILMFATFDLRPRQVARLSLLSLLLLAAAMAFNVLVWPRQVSLEREFALYLVMLVTVPGVWVLSLRLAHIRARLVQQREELRSTLGKLQVLAERDALTGLYNRRLAERLLNRALRRHQRSGTPFAVALIDLDRFKQVNDQYGHAAGDAVLRHFATVAQQGLRDTDTLARWGGEEFLLLIDDADLDAVRSTAERLRRAVQMSPVPLERGTLGVTVSVGATCAYRGEDVAPLLRRADAALYKAKENGRNRVELLA